MSHEVMQKSSTSSKLHFVPLEEPPDQFPIPPDLQARFSYDSVRKVLTFQGWMCKATYDRLRNVSQDYHFQRALERLFQVAVPEEDRPSHQGLGRLLVAGIVLVIGAAAACGVLFHSH
jgi:hypothetical protein